MSDGGQIRGDLLPKSRSGIWKAPVKKNGSQRLRIMKLQRPVPGPFRPPLPPGPPPSGAARAASPPSFGRGLDVSAVSSLFTAVSGLVAAATTLLLSPSSVESPAPYPQFRGGAPSGSGGSEQGSFSSSAISSRPAASAPPPSSAHCPSVRGAVGARADDPAALVPSGARRHGSPEQFSTPSFAAVVRCAAPGSSSFSSGPPTPSGCRGGRRDPFVA